jgi:hypothetical protein
MDYKKRRGKMACQRSIAHSEQERKDGVPKKHDLKNGHMSKRKKREREKNIAMSSCHSNKGDRDSCKESFILIIHHPYSTHMHNLV